MRKLVGIVVSVLAFAGMAGTLVIAPGNGVTTNVTDVIGGVTDVQINDAATGGGIVKLAARNTYRGTTFVKSGTLEVSTVGTVSQPGSMGAPASPTGAIRLGNGTLRYTGPGETTDRALVLAPDSSIADLPGILEVADADATLTFLGGVSVSGSTGHFIKTGPGTLAFEHQTPGAYHFAAGSYANNNYIDFKANGDSPTKGFRAFTIANGAVVFDNPLTVTNYFANEVQPGALSTSAAGAETGGRLVFRNGTHICEGWLSVACICGTDVTNPDYAHAGILDVENGYVRAGNIGLAYCHNSDWDKARPHGIINVSGGTLYTPGVLRIDHTRSWGTVNVSGGTMQVNGVNVAHYTRGSQFDLNVQGPGQFIAGSINFGVETTTKGATSAKRTTRTTIRLTDGAVFSSGTMKSSYPAYSTATVHVDNAALTMKGDWRDVTFRVGATAPTLTLTQNALLAAPVSLEDGVATSTPLVISGGYQLTCTNTVRLPGGIRVAAGTLAATDLVQTPVTLDAGATFRTTTSPLTLPALAMPADAVLVIGFSGSTPSTVTCESWTPPTSSIVVDLCVGATATAFTTAGTYDLLTFPATVDFDCSRAAVRSPASGRAYTFSIVTAGATKTLRVTIAADASNVWSSSTYDTRLYTFAGTGVSNDTVVINGTKNLVCGFEILGDTTLAHGLTATQGGFMKLGSGTLTLAGAYDYTFGKSAATTGFLDANISDFDWFGDDGTSRLSYNIFTIADGRFVFGAPGQKFSTAGEFWIGTSTTSEAGKETTGEAVFNGGEGTINSYLVVGRNNGSILATGDTRPNGEPLRSRFTMNGGTLTVGGLITGYNNARDAGMESVFEMNGGIFRQRGVNGGKNSVRIGANNYAGSKVWHLLHGGSFTCDDILRVSQAGCEAHVVADGGAVLDLRTGMTITGYNEVTLAFTNATLRCVGAFSGSATKTSFYANGLTYRPVFSASNSDMNLTGFKTFEIGANGLTVVLDEFNGNWCGLPPPSGSGALVVEGTGDPRTAVAFRSGCGTFTGGVTTRAAGFAITSNDCAALDVRLTEGGSLITTVNTTPEGVEDCIVSVKTLTCGADASDTSTLVPVYVTSSPGDVLAPIRVTDTLTVNGTVAVAFRVGGLAGRHVPSFTSAKRVLIAPKGSIDASKFVLASDYADASATFRVETFDADCDALVVEFATPASHSHVWQAGSGDWGTAANWSVAPEDVACDPITFPATLAADATVNLGGTRTVGSVAQASARDVTLTGGALALDAGDGNTPTLVSRGGGTLAVPIASVAGGTLATKGCVALTRNLPAETAVTHGHGILSGAPAAFGSNALKVESGTLRPTADGAICASVTSAGRGLRVDVPEGVVASQIGSFANSRPFIKSGRGEYIFAVPGTTTLSSSSGADMNQANAFYSLPADGSFPTNGLGSVLIAGGTFTFGREGQTLNVFNSEMWVGGHPIVENGDPQDVTVNMMGGTLVVRSYLGIGRNRYDAALFTAMTRRPNYTFNQYAGDVNADAFIMCWDNTFNQRCLATYNLFDGTMTVGNRFGMGHHPCTVAETEALGASECVFNVYGGSLLVKNGSEAMTIGGQSNPGCGRMNVYGGVVEVLKDAVRVANNGGQGTLHLAGGTLIARQLASYNASSVSTVIWDGGVYKPATNATAIVVNITSNLVAAGGAKIDTSLYAGTKIALAQTIVHDPACAGADGGLAKYGTGVLALTAAMDFTGPLAAFGGGISLEQAASYAVPSVKGCAAITNGTLAVSGFVQPCAEETNGWQAATLEVDSLAFGAGAQWKVAVNDAATQATVLKVNGALTAAQTVTVDFARTADDPLPTTLDVKIAEFAAKPATLPAFACANTGITSGHTVRVRRVNDVELHAVAIPVGLQIIVR